MKLVKAAILASATGLAFCSCSNSDTNAKLKTKMDTVSYAIGLNFGQAVAREVSQMPGGDSVSTTCFKAGFNTGFKNDTTVKALFTEEEAQRILQSYFEEKQLEKNRKEADEYQQSRAANDKYIDEKISEGGYIQIENTKGIECKPVLLKVTEPGKGDLIKETDFALINYRGSLINGKEFDSSTKHGNDPAIFPVNRVIPGFTMGLTALKKGAKAQLIIPSELGYGRQAMGSDIPANSILVFDVDVVDVFHTEKEMQAYMRQKNSQNK